VRMPCAESFLAHLNLLLSPGHGHCVVLPPRHHLCKGRVSSESVFVLGGLRTLTWQGDVHEQVC